MEGYWRIRVSLQLGSVRVIGKVIWKVIVISKLSVRVCVTVIRSFSIKGPLGKAYLYESGALHHKLAVAVALQQHF